MIELMADLANWADLDGNHPAGVAGYEDRRFPVGSGVSESHPVVCLNGHPLVPPNYTSSWLPCTCAGPEHSNALVLNVRRAPHLV